MTVGRVFLDTNILVYAFDDDDPVKHREANRLIRDLWTRQTRPALSVQVLQEFWVTLARKGAAPAVADMLLRDYLRWDVVANDASVLVDGIAITQRWQLSLWDSLIIAAAKRAGADAVLSEDMTHNQDYSGVRVINPFAASVNFQ